jgi:hypothetical protein
MSQLSGTGTGGGPGRASRMLRADTSSLRFRGPRSPYLFLLVALLIGALLGVLITWLIVSPDPDDPVAVDYVPGLATVDGKGKQITLFDPSGQLLGRLEITKLTDGRQCLKGAPPQTEVIAGVLHVQPDENIPQPRNVLVSVECAGGDQPRDRQTDQGGGDGGGNDGGGG